MLNPENPHEFALRKIRVFVSSKIDGIYGTLRKNLKYMLQETGLFSVYVYEGEPASSKRSRELYLQEIDRSDVCIFLILNEDGASSAVLEEQKRARNKYRKCIYIFCDAQTKEPTEIQNGLKTNEGEKYDTAHEYSEIVPMAYTSLIIDILNNYSFQTGTQNRNSDANIGLNEITSLRFTPFNKAMLRGFDKTSQLLCQQLSLFPQEVKNTSNLDAVSVRLIKSFLYTEKIEGEEISKIISEIIDLYAVEYRPFIDLKLRGLKNFLFGDLSGAETELKQAIEIASTSSAIPQWMLNLAAVDLRNIQYQIDWNNNLFNFTNDGQRALDKSDEPLYFPLIDSEENNLRENLLFLNHRNQLDSLYTTRSAGIENALAKVASNFYLSTYLVSIVQMISVRKRLIEVLTTHSLIYSDLGIQLELISLLILEGDKKTLEDFLRKSIFSEDIMTENNIEAAISRINNLQFDTNRIKSFSCLISLFGYCFSDGLFDQTFSMLKDKFDFWLEAKTKNDTLGNSFLDVIEYNHLRISSETICRLINKTILNHETRLYDRCCKILATIDISRTDKNLQNMTKDSILFLLGEDQKHNDIPHLNDAIINFRNRTMVEVVDLDSLILERDPIFYHQYYMDFGKAPTSQLKLSLINNLIARLQQDNEQQGKGGQYRFLAYEPVRELVGRVLGQDIKPKKKQLSNIVDLLQIRLFDKRKTKSSKIEALQLIVILRNKFPDAMPWQDVFIKIIDEDELVLDSVDEIFFEHGTNNTLSFHISFLAFMSGINPLLDLVIRTLHFDDAELNNILYLLNIYLETSKTLSHTPETLKNLFLIAINALQKKETQIRYLAIRLLTNLVDTEYQSDALNELIRTFDSDTPKVRAIIIRGLKRKNISSENHEKFDYILQKAKIDSNFGVRAMAG